MSFLTDIQREQLLRKDKPILDSCGSGGKEKESAILDGVADYAISDLKIKAAAAIQQWADADIPLANDETFADRLQALLIGIIDANKNGEIDEDEADAFDIVAGFAVDYMVSHGVDEDDAVNVLDDEETAGRVRDLLIEQLPDDDASGDDMDSFAFLDKAGSRSIEEDVLDAIYKKRTVIRDGKKVRINKRISGTVHLSGAQKAAIRKAGIKSHSAEAVMRRAKSMRMRVKSGLK